VKAFVARQGPWCFRHHGVVILAWLILGMTLVLLGHQAETRYIGDVSMPSSESEHARRTAVDAFPGPSGDVLKIVVTTCPGDQRNVVGATCRGRVDDPPVRRRLERLFGSIRRMAHVAHVASPYAPGRAQQINRDRTVAYAQVRFDQSGERLPGSAVRHVVEAAEAGRQSDLQIQLLGEMVSESPRRHGFAAEALGLLLTTVILRRFFRSWLATALPLLIGIIGVGAGLVVVELVSPLIPAAAFYPKLVRMVGVAVAVDYALFQMDRFRRARRDGADVATAVATASTSAGRAVVWAAVTFAAAMLSLFAEPIELLHSVAITVVITVCLTTLASVTLIPALLRLVGHRIPVAPARDSGWAWSWTRRVQHRPWVALLIGLCLLLALWLPAWGVRGRIATAGNDADGATTRAAYELLARGFGDGINGPFTLVATVPRLADAPAVTRLRGTVTEDRGVAAVAAPRWDLGRTTAVLVVYPRADPGTEMAEDLLDRLRVTIVPQAVHGTRAHVAVGGVTATSRDLAVGLNPLGAAQAPFVGLVLTVSGLLLLLAFRSVLVPVKAAAMNLLSVAAAYGVVCLVFARGIGADLLGVAAGPVEPWLPLMIFSLLFGLSLDYEVIIVARVREEWRGGADAEAAVTRGLAETAGVVTAAAAVMAANFFSHAELADDRTIKEFGLGLGTAVAVDVTIVRLCLLPAAMQVIRRVNFYLPRWLDQMLPPLSIEGPDARHGP
jgi:putative drug exporter of the RND superfamily